MSGAGTWQKVSLGDICELKYGKSLPMHARISGPCPVYGSNGQVGSHTSSLTTGPTIIVGRKGSFGEVNFSEVGCWPIDTTYFVDCSATSVNLKWLFYRLRGLGLTELNRAAAVPGLNREDAYRKSFLLPPVHVQQHIVEVLDQVGALESKRRKAVSLIDELTQSIFSGMFGSIEENPNNFPLVKLAELVDPGDRINYGVVQPGDHFVGGIPLIRVGDLNEGRIDHSRLKYIAPSVEEKYKRSRLKGNEILVGCVGSIGAVAVASDREVGFNIARAVARIPIKSDAQRCFVAEHLRMPTVQSYFVNQLRVVAQPTLNIKQLSETEIMFPPVWLQEEFASKVAVVQRLRGSHVAHLEQVGELFDSLQHRAFRGELWED